MESNQSPRAFVYLLVLLGFITIFFILDRVFGVEYNAHEQNLSEESYSEEIPLEQLISEESKKSSVGNNESDSNEEIDTISIVNSTNTAVNKTTSADFFDQMLKAYKTGVVSTLEPGKARTDIIVRYYRHAPDGKSAYTLEELGYYIHERPVDTRYADFQSNAIYYGDSVNLQDIQIIGYALLKEGLPIKVIKPSKFGDSWKSHSIEIGTDTTLANDPTLDLNLLKSFTK